MNKKIKRYIYGTPQCALAIFPPGFAETARSEIESLLNDLWFPQKYLPVLSLQKNAIRIENIHFISLMEILMRSRCVTDLRLIIFEGKASGKKEFIKKCREVPWDFYFIKESSVKIRVDSIASRAFHEKGLKEILSEILKEKNIIESQTSESLLDVSLYKDYLTLSLSLAGEPLYKRGYRSELSASAPLRDDIAACCLRENKRFASSKEFSPNTVWVPFSGTGTFLFEAIMDCFHIAPVFLQRKYSLQTMPLFNEDSFQFLLKKGKERIEKNKEISFYFSDTSEKANEALKKNAEIFLDYLKESDISLKEKETLFFRADYTADDVDAPIWMPLNPPYGLRLNKKADSVQFYKNIAAQLNQIKNKTFAGCILCPDEETWSVFYKTLMRAEKQTYHFTQGGLDIRVCQFFIKGK